MIIDANDIPSEGMASQQLIRSIIERYGKEASLDVIMRNMPQIARQLGAKRPAVLRNHPAAQRMPPPSAQQPAVVQNLPPTEQEQPIDMPDTPNKLHTPPAKMITGAEAVPKIPMTEEELADFNKKAIEMPRPPVCPTVPPSMQQNDPYEAFMYPHRHPQTPPHPMQNPSSQIAKPSYFKDGLGNEYKIIGNDLYVLGWQDAKVKVRMVNAETGKEIPSKGRKFQIYGWHLVEKMANATVPTTADDISSFEKTVAVDNGVNAKIDDGAVVEDKAHPLIPPSVSVSTDNMSEPTEATTTSTGKGDEMKTDGDSHTVEDTVPSGTGSVPVETLIDVIKAKGANASFSKNMNEAVDTAADDELPPIPMKVVKKNGRTLI